MPLPSTLMNPPLMAIGDSLYQGVAALTHRADLFQWSPPAQVARALGITDFACADPDQPILINLPDWLHAPVSVSGIKAQLAALGRHWLGRPASPSGRVCFDNLAVSGDTIADVLDATAGGTATTIAQALKAGGDSPFSSAAVGTLLLAFVRRFTLNPSGAAEFEGMTQMDWVRLRQPRRLLVNIGSNDGLYRMCFNADAGVRMDTTRIDDLVAALAALPDAVEQIYLNTLALPRAVCNLMPILGPEQTARRPDLNPDMDFAFFAPGPEGYYDLYENRMGFTYGRRTGAQVKALDDDVRAANALFADAVKRHDRKGRIHLVDVTSLLLDYDTKHVLESQGAKVVALKNGHRLTNQGYLVDPLGNHAGGGLFSLDGMHLSHPGYALMAGRVLDTIRQAEGVAFTAPDMDAAAAADPTLSVPLPAWTIALWLWRDYRKASAGAAPPEPVGADDSRNAKAAVLGHAARVYSGGKIPAVAPAP